MSESTAIISSAVIIPESELPSSPRTKRRQSSVDDTTSKRPRLSNDGSAESPSTLRSSSPTKEQVTQESPSDKPDSTSRPNADKQSLPLDQDKRKSNIQEEKKRGRRLFGGLLSTLSQSTPNGQQKRRLEIEKRQAEKAKQQKLEDETRKAEKLAKLKEIRKVEQIKFDRESLRIRHTNMLAMANFLCTKTQPKIYYKPWELLPADKDRIKQQIEEAQAIIEREVDEFKAQFPPADPSSAGEADTNTSKETVGEPQADPPSVPNVFIDTTNPTVQESQPEQASTEKITHGEHNGEVVVVAEEDTVIY